MVDIQFSALRIAEILKLNQPIPQQRAIIEAPLDGARLVIAGAGSGKTETMAQRIVFLLANRLVAPDQILGLTFTNKAVAEFRERVGKRLGALMAADRGIFEYYREYELNTGMGVTDVSVNTYNGFAQSIVQQYGVFLGYDSEIQVISAAHSWQKMYQIVSEYTGDLDLDLSVNTVTERALSLAGEINEHLLDTAVVKAHLQQMVQDLRDFRAKGNSKKPTGIHADAIEALEVRLKLLPFVEKYQDLKLQQSVIDYSDQIRMAAQIVEHFPTVRKSIQQRYATVFLDEFQDTSASQLLFLQRLFKGQSVMAVGDPNQSIYSWRGASELSMQGFLESFSEGIDSGNYRYYPISQTFRNRARILDVANTLIKAEVDTSEDNPEKVDKDGLILEFGDWQQYGLDKLFLPQNPPLKVQKITPFHCATEESDEKTHPVNSSAGVVETYFLATAQEEAELLANRYRELLEERERQRQAGVKDCDLPTGAILVRSHSQTPLLVRVFEELGVPVQVAGSSGLLYNPAVADVIAALALLVDASDGQAMLRLLIGFGIGPADLEVLGQWARQLARDAYLDTVDLGEGKTEAEVPVIEDAETQEFVILSEAVDNLPPEDWRTSGGVSLSDDARMRIVNLSNMFKELRSYREYSLDTVVKSTIRILQIDFDSRLLGGSSATLAENALAALVKVAKEYQSSVENASLKGFLGWLSVAEEQERGLSLPTVEADPDAVQILTIHAAKGLEWTMVAIPGLSYPAKKPNNGVLPKNERNSKGERKASGWLKSSGDLPYELRQDAAILPVLRGFPEDAVFSKANAHIESYRTTLGAISELEDRRLAYVAVTRAKSYLLMGGYAYRGAEGKSLRAPSSFLLEVDPQIEQRYQELIATAASDVEQSAWDEANYPGLMAYRKPEDGAEISVWPPQSSLMEERYRKLLTHLEQACAETVPGFEILEQLLNPNLGEGERKPLISQAKAKDSWIGLAAELLSEDAKRKAVLDVHLPNRMGVTALKKLADNPEDFLRDLRRPLPATYRFGQETGTAMHEWIDHKLRHKHYEFDQMLSGSTRKQLDTLINHWQNMALANEWDYLESEQRYQINAGVTVIAEIDAVMRRKSDGKIYILDWKTDHFELSDEGEIVSPVSSLLHSYYLQIHQYRLIYANLLGVDWRTIGAALVFLRGEYIAEIPAEVEADLPQRLADLSKLFTR